MKRRRARLILLAATLVSLAGLGYKVGETVWLRKLREIEKNPLQLLDTLPEAALHVKEFHRSEVADGRKVWEVSGKEARYLQEDREVVMEKPTFAYYNKNGETLEARADQGRIYLAEKEIDRMEMFGAIRVAYQGFVLETDEIVYHKDKAQVVLPGKVSVKGTGLEVEGVGMTISLRDERLSLNSKVKTRIEPQRLRASKINLENKNRTN
ncbi:MAG TPA: LPS export ABC transporter periplasmic protein LptC [Candidatus Acidoferrales bacterium]|nr:LPS export ABC transporter periplasmic protein LptC [Candidatus Acidoferrales bacterium]